MAATPFNVGLPTQTIIQKGTELCTLPWYQFFLLLYNRTGGAAGSVSLQLDSISTTVGSLLYRGLTAWDGLNPGIANQVLVMGAEFPAWGNFNALQFGAQAANSFIAGPASGAAANPTFRKVVPADLTSVGGQYPGNAGNLGANTGNIGEYLHASGSGVSFVSSGTSYDVAAIVLPDGDWDVWGSFVSTPAGGTTQSQIRAWINTASATDPGAPNNGAYVTVQQTIGAGLSQCLPVGSMRIEGGVTVYLSANVTFAGSTLTGGGFIAARRRS